jgi:chaperonin GroES
VSVSIKPLEDRIVIKQVDAEQTTASGLVIPDTAKEKPQEGEVVAVGPGRIDDNGNRIPLDVAVGDKVIYSKYGGTEVKFGGEDLLVLSARDVLAFVVRESHALIDRIPDGLAIRDSSSLRKARPCRKARPHLAHPEGAGQSGRRGRSRARV